MSPVQRLLELLGCSGPPEQFEVWDCLDCGRERFVAAQERQWLIGFAALLRLVRYLGEASDDTRSLQAPM